MKYLSFLLAFPILLHAEQGILSSHKKQVFETAKKIVRQMSDSEKAGQLLHFTIPGKTVTPAVAKKISKLKPGGIIFFANNIGNPREIKTLTTSLQLTMQKAQGLPLLISTDQEGGKVVRITKGVTQFPSAMALGQSGNPNYSYAVGFLTSYQLKKLGINLLLAPSLDINNNPRNPVINTRSFGADSATVIRIGLAYERGARRGGAIPVIKHFPGHGDTNVDSHKGLPVIEKKLQQLEQMELTPFRQAIANGAQAVMSAHIIYPQLDKKYPATLSPKVLRAILRKKFGFNGIVMTDAMEMDAISKNYQNENTAALAIKAGADIILLVSWENKPEAYLKMIVKAMQKGAFKVGKEDLLEQAVIRQIAVKIENGLLHESYSYHKANSPILNSYIKRKAQVREKIYAKLAKIGVAKINTRVSRASIRSYVKPFVPLQSTALKTTALFRGSNASVAEYKRRKLTTFSYKKLASILASPKYKTLVLETNGEKSVSKFSRLIKKYPKKKFVLLHSGNPFLEQLPKSSNSHVLFSFSPTLESKKALIHNLLNGQKGKKVPVAKLVFD
ncbi:MAG: glycoside hydrolase family 3 protein [Spirochaetota bacterium]